MTARAQLLCAVAAVVALALVNAAVELIASIDAAAPLTLATILLGFIAAAMFQAFRPTR